MARLEPVCAALVLLFAVPAASQRAPALQSSELAAAAAAEKSGKYETAARHYQEFLATATPSTPGSAVVEARTRLAVALFMLHHYHESLEALGPLYFSPGGLSQSSAAAAIPAQVWLVRGLDELQLNQLPESIRSLRQALALDETSGTARLALGDALARNSELEEAVKVYRDQLRRAPGTVDAWYKLGSVYEELAGKLSSDFAHRPGDRTLATQLSAEQLLDRGDYWGAAKGLFPLIQGGSMPAPPASAPPFQPGLHATFGTALLQLGYPRAAGREFKAELSQDPDSLPAELGMAEIEALNSNWYAALGIFGRLMALYPKELALQLESPPAAPLREAMKKRSLAPRPQLPESPAGRLWEQWLGSAGLESIPQLGSRPESCSPPASRQARLPGYWTSEPCSGELLNELRARKNLPESEHAKLVEAEYRLGDYEAAADGGRALLREFPADPWAYYWLAKSYSALAGSCFDKLAEAGPDSARVHEILARYHSERQQLAAARAEYEVALRLDPGLPDLHLGLGTVYWQSGDWSQAESELGKALELAPASAVAAYELGDCFVQQHRWQGATSPLERALGDPAVERGARLDLAKAQAELGETGPAIKNLILLAAGDRDGEVHYRLAMIYRKMGDPARAQEALAQSEALRKAADQRGQNQIKALEQESGGAPPPNLAPASHN